MESFYFDSIRLMKLARLLKWKHTFLTEIEMKLQNQKNVEIEQKKWKGIKVDSLYNKS